jgi:hypothetical protein
VDAANAMTCYHADAMANIIALRACFKSPYFRGKSFLKVLKSLKSLGCDTVVTLLTNNG